MKNYIVEYVIENEKIKNKSGIPIYTELKIKENKPDILVYDKKLNIIVIVEVRVTSKQKLGKIERGKKHKYEPLIMYKREAGVIPYVIKWDGLVTRNHTNCVKK
ncbi:hypothetical protein ENBRE01_2358 [Enteropsectra breve]|nr:hypothetical protein ENBRE01_2358 [Enteropsectra breve]